MTQFEKMISELSDILQIPLHVEHGNLCGLTINQTMQVQIEDDQVQHRILLLIQICAVSPGKFRENVLREALKINFHFPRIGTFSFLEKNDALCLHTYFYFREMTGMMMAEALSAFIEVSETCLQSIESGRVPAL